VLSWINIGQAKPPEMMMRGLAGVARRPAKMLET
jgi:hypothetical protein